MSDASGLTIPSEKKRIRQRMTGMYCTKCGAKLPHDARFCMNCGKPVAAIAPAKVVGPTGAPAKAANPAAASREAAAPAAAPAKTVVPAFASEAADAGRHGASPSGHPSNASSQNGSASFDSLQRIPHSAIPRLKAPLLRMSPKSHARPAHAARLRCLKRTSRQSVPKRCVVR